MLTKTEEKWIRPILRWAGSKRKLLPKLMACAPTSYNRYIEPFLGSACFFLALQPKRAVLGDFNVDLMDMYCVLRNSPQKLASLVHDMPESAEYYYSMRAKCAAEMTKLDRAARFIYLNRYCFNGVYRTNRKGQFNVPRGRHTGNVPSINEFRACARMFRNVELRTGDFEDCLVDIRRNDFVYLDPPYALFSRLDYGEYGYDSFDEDDIERLIRCVIRADKKGAIVLLSYAYTPILKKALPSWHHRKIAVRRYVAGFSHQRDVVSEALISNHPLPHNLHRIK